MTKQKKNTMAMAGLFACLIVFVISTNALAAPDVYSDVWADVLWDTLDISLGSGMSLEYLPSTDGPLLYSSSDAYADNSYSELDEVFDEIWDWADTSAEVNLSNVRSDALTDDSWLSSTVYTYESAGGSSEKWAYGDSEAYRDGTFEIIGAGWVQVSVDYQVEVDLLASADDQEAYGYAEAWLGLFNYNTFDESYSDNYSEGDIMGPDAFLENLTGTLYVSVYFNDGDIGILGSGAYTDADIYIVPEPATLALLGFGGLMVGRKK